MNDATKFVLALIVLVLAVWGVSFTPPRVLAVDGCRYLESWAGHLTLERDRLLKPVCRP